MKHVHRKKIFNKTKSRRTRIFHGERKLHGSKKQFQNFYCLMMNRYLNFSAKQWKQEEKLLNEANWNGKNWKYELNMETPWCGLWGEGTRKFIRISVAKGNVTWEEIKKCQRNGNNVSTIHSVPQLRWKFSDVHKSSLSVSISSVRQRKLVSYSKALSKHGEENSYKFKGKVRNRMGWWKPQ